MAFDVGIGAERVVDDLQALADGGPPQLALLVGLLAALPVACILLYQHHKLAIGAVVAWFATVGAWLAFYASDRFNPGSDDAFGVVAVGTTATWLLLLTAAVASASGTSSGRSR